MTGRLRRATATLAITLAIGASAAAAAPTVQDIWALHQTSGLNVFCIAHDDQDGPASIQCYPRWPESYP